LRLLACTDKEKLETTLKSVNSLFITDIIVGFDEDETIEVVVGKMLTKQNKQLQPLKLYRRKIAQLLTQHGASAYFKGSIVLCYNS
jgi:nicotinamide-nucleotide amidase